MSITPAHDSEQRSLTSLIGWLSLCLLAAGWGVQLDSTVRQLWANFGLFGLASAIGLEVVQRTRRVHRRRKQRRTTDRRIGQNLTKLAAANATIKQLNAALRRIAEEEQESDQSANERRGETRLPFSCAVQVTPLDYSGRPSTEDGDSTFTAHIRDISAGGVGLIHNQPIPSERVMLTFKLGRGETISIVAELTWRHHQPDGMYSSGGKLIEVMAPVSPREPVTAGAG